MSETGQVIPFESAVRPASFAAVRRHLTRLLLHHTLVDSFGNFRDAGKPYPFARPSELMPDAASRSTERSYQNTALVFAVDGQLPVALNKHFRLRASNQVTWRNIQRLAPELDLSDYKVDDSRFDSGSIDRLVTKLLPLDYALLVQLAAEDDLGNAAFQLSHLHVKVERLTDNAIKDLGRRLGYIDRRLFERGEDYVDALESKFFEYHGFPPNASGRKSAGAMAAQLFGDAGLEFAVYVASQDNNRLIVLDHSELVRHYLLVRLDARELPHFQSALAAAGRADASPYLVAAEDDAGPVLLLRARFKRTAAARASQRARRDKDVLQPWLELVDEFVLARPDTGAPELAFAWSSLSRD
jgi:hypothetical protein